MSPPAIKCWLFTVIALCVNAATTQGQVIVQRDIYTSNYDSQINHYTSSGGFAGSFSIPTTYGNQVKGMAYGPDGLMYATVGMNGGGYQVVALNSAGTVVQTYSGTDNVTGNISYGKLAFGLDNQFFVSGGGGVRRFTIGSPTGTQVFSSGSVFDSTVLPSGNLLVLAPYHLYEMTPSGTIVREINSSISLGDARGVAYNPMANDIYVTMLGYTGQSFRLMRLDGTTGNVEKNVFFWYADDLFLGSDNRLFVGSRTQPTGIFDLDLNQIGALGSDEQMFVTQLVPEPGSMCLLAIAGLGLGIRGIKKRIAQV